MVPEYLYRDLLHMQRTSTEKETETDAITKESQQYIAVMMR